jgi:predicted transporter
MKKLALAMAVGVAFVNAASAYTLPTTAVAPVRVPEPSSFMLTAMGLIVLGGLAFVVRKRVRTNEAN